VIVYNFLDYSQVGCAGIKKIINDDGGLLTLDNVTLKIDAGAVDNDTITTVLAGERTVSEDLDAGVGVYGVSFTGACDGDGKVTLVPGDSLTCTITNNDSSATNLTVIKKIINDHGGPLTLDNVTLKIDGGAVDNDTATTVDAGERTVSEELEAGVGVYAATITGDCDADGKITLLPGDSKTCTITNDDSSATNLTVIKKIINDHGGLLEIDNVTLKIDGADEVGNNTVSTVLAGEHTVSEDLDAGVGVYDVSFTGACDGDGKVTLLPGDSKTCTITNDDTSDTDLTVIKKIINDDGGPLTIDNVTLKIDGGAVDNDTATVVLAGERTVSEVLAGGVGSYVATITGDCDGDGKITLVPGDSKTCTITNNDVEASTSLIVIKSVRGGGAQPNDFELTVRGDSVSSGVTTLVDPDDDFFLGETQQPGYSFIEITGAGCPEELGDVFAIGFGENPVCTIVNKKPSNDRTIDPPTLSDPTLTSLGNPETGLGGTIELDLNIVTEPVTAVVGDILLITFAIDENQGKTNLGRLCTYIDNEGKILESNELSITEAKRQHYSTEICYYRFDNPPVTVTDTTGLVSQVDLTIVEDYKDENDARTFKGILTLMVMHEIIHTDFFATIDDQDGNPHSMEVKNVFNVISPEEFADLVKDIADWWSQGFTSDAEFIQAIQFLIDEGVIVITEIDPSLTIPASFEEIEESEEIPDWIKLLAEWWALGLLEDDSFYKVIEYLVNTGVIVL